jgi:hypothetical protein
MNEEQVTGEPTVENDFTAEIQEKQGFTQEELDRIVKERLGRERSKILKQYEGVDVEKYRALIDAEEKKQTEEQAKRGQFEEILKTTVGKKDAAIQQLQKELQAIKVDGAVLNAASSRKAVNPQQVVRLLKDQIRLNDAGQVEVLDESGSIRYNDSGALMTADELVNDFLSNNPHFVGAGPSGTGSQSSVAQANGKMGIPDMENLDMNDPAQRVVFKQLMKSKGIRV